MQIKITANLRKLEKKNYRKFEVENLTKMKRIFISSPKAKTNFPYKISKIFDSGFYKTLKLFLFLGSPHIKKRYFRVHQIFGVIPILSHTPRGVRKSKISTTLHHL